MRIARFALCLVVFLSVPGIGVAQSAPAKASTDALTDQARELHVKGAALYDQGQYDKAEAAFLAAWALKKHYQIAANLGACEVKLGKYRDAAEHLAFFLREQPPSRNKDERQRAQALFDEVRPKVGTLTIKIDVPGTIVTVDGHEVGTAPLPAEVYVEPGRHTIDAVRAADPGASVTVSVGAGEAREVTLALNKKEALPPPPRVEKRPLWPVIAAGGVAVVALGVGAGLTVAANGKAGDSAALRANVGPAGCASASAANTADCSSVVKDLQSQGTFAKGAAGALVSGGALAVATAGLAAWAMAVPVAKVRIMPAVGTNNASVVVIGAW